MLLHAGVEKGDAGSHKDNQKAKRCHGAHRQAVKQQPQKNRDPMRPTLPDAHFAGRQIADILKGKRPEQQSTRNHRRKNSGLKTL